MAEHHPHHRHADLVDGIAVRTDLAVVAEPVRQLVRVGHAADPGEQRHVERARLRTLVEPRVTGDAARDDRLAQDVFFGQAEAEVGGERQRCDQLGQPHARRALRNTHARQCDGAA